MGHGGMACVPRYLLLSLLPVLLGSVLAAGPEATIHTKNPHLDEFHLNHFIATVVAYCVASNRNPNLINDYYDYLHWCCYRRAAGPGLIQQGLINPSIIATTAGLIRARTWCVDWPDRGCAWGAVGLCWDLLVYCAWLGATSRAAFSSLFLD